MTEYCYLRGEYVDMEKASLPVRTHAFLYGTSVFEGIRAYYNEKDDDLYIFRMKEHYERILRSAKVMHMEDKYSIEEMMDITKKLLKMNNYKQDAYIRPTIYKYKQTVGPGLYNNPDDLLIFTTPLGEYIDISKGLKVCVSNWRRNDDNAIPPRAKVSGGYANAALIVTDARLAGFDDAIVLSHDGTVTEGSAMNLFLLQNGKLITTKTTDNILVGVTRNTVIEIARNELNLEVVERDIDRTELYISDGAFYCGTGAQISPIVSIDNRKLGDGNVHPIILQLQKLYFDIVKGNVPKYKHWCVSVND